MGKCPVCGSQGPSYQPERAAARGDFSFPQCSKRRARSVRVHKDIWGSVASARETRSGTPPPNCVIPVILMRQSARESNSRREKFVFARFPPTLYMSDAELVPVQPAFTRSCITPRPRCSSREKHKAQSTTQATDDFQILAPRASQVHRYSVFQ